jgi:hypothetical protein
MDCCGGHAGHNKENTNNHEEKKIPWLSIIIALLVMGILIFSILN